MNETTQMSDGTTVEFEDTNSISRTLRAEKKASFMVGLVMKVGITKSQDTAQVLLIGMSLLFFMASGIIFAITIGLGN